MKIVSLAALLVILSSAVMGISIGAAPGSINFGSVSPGSTVSQNIYIRASDVDQNFTVNPSANTISPRSLFTGTVDNKDEVSEQAGLNWWVFEQSNVNPSTNIPPSEIPESNVPTVQGVTEMMLQIPEDAEPGIRYGHIRLNADLGTANGTGSGARIVTPTRISYSYRVPGDVRRDVAVRDVRAFRLGQDQAAVEVLLSNEGTVTTTADTFSIDVLGPDGSRETSLIVDGITLEPGESQWVDGSWVSGDGIEEGSYQIDGQVDFLTGQSTASGSFTLPDFNVVEVRPESSPGSNESSKDTIPIWLVFMVLAILAVLMWSFDIEPFWIMAIVGGLAISAFILLSGVSNYLLVVLLMAVGIIVYGVM